MISPRSRAVHERLRGTAGPRLRLVTGAAALVLLSAGCGADASGRAGPAAAPTTDPGFGHVHGLAVNPGDGVLYAATHFGVWRIPAGGEPVRVADRYQDTMGFTVVGPDHFLGSGHPDLREDLPPHLGLIESRDAAKTWRSLSLQGGADFHALEAKHDRVYGYDSTSSTFMVSRDKRAWQRRARTVLTDFTVSPDHQDVVLGAGRGGLVHSDDGGETFALVDGSPELVFVDWSPRGLYGVDISGGVWASVDGGARWSGRGEIGGAPTAVTVTSSGHLYAATDDGVLASEDGGRTFTSVID